MLLTIAGGVVAAAAASVAGYHTMGPTSQLYGRTFTGVAPGTRTLALTYDDGPNDPWTLRLLDVLAANEVRATFFMIGQFVQQRPDIARRVAEAGHVVGNHTFTHPNLIFASSAQLRRELELTELVLSDAVGPHSKLFRPPFGARRPATLRVVRDMGLTPVMWRVTCYDWSAKSNESIERHATRQIRGGDVVLLHDGGHVAMGADRSHTVKATDNLIRRYRGEGYEFTTVTEMMQQTVAVQSA